VNRFQFVADHRHTFEVKRLCEVIGVARSSFYAWHKAAPARAARTAADLALAQEIRALQDSEQGGDPAYGVPRITADLNDDAPEGERVNHKKVARVMHEHGLAGIRLRRRVRTTTADQSARKHPDLLGRDFSAQNVGEKYVGDITYLPLAGGRNFYLATVIDLCSRKLAGWALDDHMRTDLVADALRAAARDRGSLDGAVFHSDHGSVYTSKAYEDLCAELGVTQSMGAIGSSADNAAAESFNATLKRETLAGAVTYTDEATLRRTVFRWAHRYNTRRRHSWCANLAPNAFEASRASMLASAS
jgi:transposase InsO family protein